MKVKACIYKDMELNSLKVSGLRKTMYAVSVSVSAGETPSFQNRYHIAVLFFKYIQLMAITNFIDLFMGIV